MTFDEHYAYESFDRSLSSFLPLCPSFRTQPAEPAERICILFSSPFPFVTHPTLPLSPYFSALHFPFADSFCLARHTRADRLAIVTSSSGGRLSWMIFVNVVLP